ncbi:Hypothetical predicted protein, partial [Paramuricea clavata]
TNLQHLGVPDELVSLITNAYTGATTSVRVGQETTDPIPIRAGVKQGCPLSAVLFNLCLELVIRSVKQKAADLPKNQSLLHFETLLSCLAYADDLVLVARSKDALQALLDSASSAGRDQHRREQVRLCFFVRAKQEPGAQHFFCEPARLY